MNGPLFWLWWNNLRGAVLRRLRRLREPKYMIGGLLAMCYFGMIGYQMVIGRGVASRGMIRDTDSALLVLSTGFLLLMLLAGWLVPGKRAALTFNEHEIAWLFPAPLSRVQLLNSRLLFGQLPILFATLIISSVFGRISPLPWWQDWATAWMIWMNGILHVMVASVCSERLAARGITEPLRRCLVMGLIVITFWLVQQQARTIAPSVPIHEITGKQWAAAARETPLLQILTAPTRAVFAPIFERGTGAWLGTLPVPLALLAGHWLLLLLIHRPFEEASIDLAKKRAERIAALQSGRFFSRRAANECIPLFPLKPEGCRWIALTWKQLTGSVTRGSLRNLLAVSGLIIGGILYAHGTLDRRYWDPRMVGIAAGTVAYLSMVMIFFGAPWRAAMALCGELGNTDQMRAWPLKPWQVVLGQLLGPLVRMTVYGWLLLALGAAATMPFATKPVFPFSMLLSLTAAIALIFPGIAVLLTGVPSALVLYFPGWFLPGTKKLQQGPENAVAGMFAMILLFAVVTAGLVPVALFAGLLFWLGLNPWTPAGLITAGLGGCLLLAAESVFVIRFLGMLFARYDFSEASLGSRKRRGKVKRQQVDP